ncbi:FAD:protein FMN transferase [Thermodesulfobacteriota bacterium]
MSPRFTATEKNFNAVKGICNVMGTFVTIIAVYPDLEFAQTAVRLAFDEIYRVNDLMSVHKTDSEVSELNKNGFHDSVSHDTKYVIQRAICFSELTNGAFDITLLPVLKMWERHTRNKSMPAKSELNRNLGLVGYKNIAIKGNGIKFRKDDMSVTLAGVAKGYAVDKAIEILRQNGIRHAMVNGGGDIRVINGKTDDSPWKIGLIDPLNRKRFFTTVDLYNQAIATSGAYQRSFNDLLDPEEGRPNQEILSSTIITEKAIDADVLATAFLISGRRKGMKILDKFGDARSLCVTNEGRFIRLV